MTRIEALKKLIAVEPIEKDEMYRACGWPMLEMEQYLRELEQSGQVVRSGGGGGNRVCYRVAA